MNIYYETIRVFHAHLIENYKTENRVNSLVNKMFSESFISIDDLEDITKTAVTRDKTKKLSEMLLLGNKLLNYKHMYDVILKELKDDRSSISERLESTLEQTEAGFEKRDKEPDNKYIETIQKTYAYLINNYNVECQINELANVMFAEGCIDLDDLEEISKTVLNKVKMAKLLQRILRLNGILNFKRVYTTLVDEIRSDRPDIADVLMKTLEECSAESSGVLQEYADSVVSREEYMQPARAESRSTDTFITTPLIEACYRKDTDEVRALLRDSRTNVNSAKNDGWTALMFVAKFGCVDIVELLLQQADIDVNQADMYGSTALIEACFGGHERVVQLLMNHANIRADVTKEDGMAPLMFAVTNSLMSTLLLLTRGVNVNHSNADGATALMYAVYASRDDTANVLLRHVDIEVNRARKDGMTALMLAITLGQTAIAHLLLGNINIDVFAKNDENLTARDLAGMNGNWEIFNKIQNCMSKK